MLASRLLEQSGTGMNINWLMWLALGFFVVMVVVGWLSSRHLKPGEPEPVQRHEKPKHG